MTAIELQQNASTPSTDRRLPPEWPQNQPNVREYWYVVYHHRRAAAAFFVFVILLTLLSIPWGNRTYTATTIVYIPSQNRGVLDVPEAGNQQNNYYETQRRLLKSRSLAAQVIKDLALDKNPAFTETSRSFLSWCLKAARTVVGTAVDWVGEYLGGETATSDTAEFEFGIHPALIDRYMVALNVDPIPESQLIEVDVRSPSANLAKAVANAHAATFISRNLVTRFELTAETRQFLEKKLTELKANVENSERALNKFQREHEITSVDRGGNLLLDQLKKLNSDLTEARSKRIELESLHHLVQKGDVEHLTQIIDNPNVQQFRKQIAALQTQLAHLSTKFKSTYPGVISLQQEIAEAKNRLDDEVKRIARTIERDYGATRAKEAALAAETDKARRVALDLQEQAVEYAVLEREVASNRALYEAVFKKTKEATLTAEDPMPNLRVVDRADVPIIPNIADWQWMLALGIGSGLFGGIGLAFLLNLFDNKLRTPEDVGRALQLSTLGIVPDITKLANGQPQQPVSLTKRFSLRRAALKAEVARNTQALVSHHPLSLVGEMYRTICTAILFSMPDKPPQTILITSSRPAEGKTLTAINLSMTLAQSYGPVLLIDADLRDGRCHRLLGLSNGNGLSNVLTGNSDLAKAIKATRLKNLSLLGAGTAPPNPADLLGSDKVQQTLNTLADNFRFIVIDSAPLLPVSDTVLLSTKVDGVILVARGQEISCQLIRKARERLDYVGAKVLGVVLNAIDLRSPEYAEYRLVYQSHYAHYGRNESDEPHNMLAKAEHRGDTLPPLFFDHMAQTLTRFVGPMASVILHDEIVAMAESLDAFPLARVEELVTAVAREISDERLKAAFRRQVVEEVKNFI